MNILTLSSIYSSDWSGSDNISKESKFCTAFLNFLTHLCRCPQEVCVTEIIFFLIIQTSSNRRKSYLHIFLVFMNVKFKLNLLFYIF